MSAASKWAPPITCRAAFDPVLLKARVAASLSQKRWRDRERLYLAQIQKQKKRTDALLRVVIPLGAALAAEPDFDRLLSRIVLGAMSFCRADSGVLYLLTRDDQLEHVIVRSTRLGIALGGGQNEAAALPSLHCYEPATGMPDRKQAAVRAALSGVTINLPDAPASRLAYLKVEDLVASAVAGSRTLAQDYHTQSLLLLPLVNRANRVIGVLQLGNAEGDAGTVQPFDAELQEMVESLSLLAGLALESYQREQELKRQIADLRIQLDQVHQVNSVAEIIETPYFRQLQQEAMDLRQIINGDDE